MQAILLCPLGNSLVSKICPLISNNTSSSMGDQTVHKSQIILMKNNGLIDLWHLQTDISLISFKSQNNGRVEGLLIDVYLDDMLRNNKCYGLFNYQSPEQFFLFILYYFAFLNEKCLSTTVFLNVFFRCFSKFNSALVWCVCVCVRVCVCVCLLEHALM